nr:hypothetical polypeptide II [Hyposoter didymator ichnovirus]
MGNLLVKRTYRNSSVSISGFGTTNFIVDEAEESILFVARFLVMDTLCTLSC